MALECSYTNNDPAVIAGCYVSTLQKLCYRPEKNSFRLWQGDGKRCCNPGCLISYHRVKIYGISPSRQKIVSFWSCFRRKFAQSWIDPCEDMELHKHRMSRFCVRGLFTSVH